MSHSVTREAQRAIQSRASLISAAALFYLSGAMDTEAQPATDEPAPTTQQAPPAQAPTVEPPTTDQPAPQPAPQQAPPEQNAPKADVPLPTVSVQAERPRAPRRQQAARPAPQAQPAAPPPPTAPTDAQGTAATAGTAGTGGYRATSPSLTRLPTSILDTPQTINVVTQQVIQEQVSATVRDALRNVAGRHLPRRRGRQPGRHALHPRLLGAERHLPRRRARSGLVYARHLRGRRGRGLQGAGRRPVRPRLDRRRRSTSSARRRSSATSSKAPSPATPVPACAPRSMPTARPPTIFGCAW